jgi:hypothetical protein
VYITSFPSSGERVQVSSNGGVQPVWRRDGRQLYYLDPKGALCSVPIDLSGKVGTPRQLFTTGLKESSPWIEQYAASPDGRSFLVLDPVETKAPDRIGVIVNWPALLRAPTSR